MINDKVYLNPKLFDDDVEQIPSRKGFGEGLVLAGEADKNVVALCADLTESTRIEDFKKKFPDRYVEVGVAEQNLVTVASGMAAAGKIPFTSSYAMFSPGRNWEQIRTTICYNDRPVKIVGSHAGVSVGPDGATHQAIEDMAIMRALPNMVVISPCDAIEAKKATQAMARDPQPNYIRLSRSNVPLVTTEQTPFEIGKAEVFHEGKDVTVIACGQLVYQALLAAKELGHAEKGKISVRVINCHTIKPLDKKTILEAAEETGAIVTAEEHQVMGGLGSAIAELVSQNYPVPIKMVGVQDHFGESGEPSELLEKFGLLKKDIIKAITHVLRLKQK
jgi:transketolase